MERSSPSDTVVVTDDERLAVAVEPEGFDVVVEPRELRDRFPTPLVAPDSELTSLPFCHSAPHAPLFLVDQCELSARLEIRTAIAQSFRLRLADSTIGVRIMIVFLLGEAARSTFERPVKNLF
jgi:hypothetical protein